MLRMLRCLYLFNYFKNYLSLALLTTFIISCGAPAWAQDFNTRYINEFVENCDRIASDYDPDSQQTLSPVQRITALRTNLDLELAAAAMDCLQQITGEVWLYNPQTGRFVTGPVNEDLVAFWINQRQLQLQRLERTAEQVEVILATRDACIALFDRDRQAALINQICNGIFLEFGLPN